MQSLTLKWLLVFIWQGDNGDGNQVNAWGDYKPNLGSRPKTAHGSRMAGRPNTNPMSYEYRGSSARPGTAGTTHCRKCGKVSGGLRKLDSVVIGGVAYDF